jgi:RNA recognition motif-containing protein
MDTEVAEKSNKLYVGNLPYKIDDQPFRDEELKNIFAGIGEVSEASVIIEKDTGRSKGFGFVTFADEDTAEKALNELNGKEFGGRELRISYARPMRDRDDR